MTLSNRDRVRKLDLLFASRRSASSSFRYHSTRNVSSKPSQSTWGRGLAVLRGKGLETSRRELVEASRDITRRPKPDLTGAVQHSRAALECVARAVAGAPGLVLSQILEQQPDILPDPLITEAALKLWGYASDRGAHLREGNCPTYEEAELIVGLSSTLCLYLARTYEPNKHKLN